MSECKCGNPNCDGSKCQCGDSCGCETVKVPMQQKTFEQILAEKQAKDCKTDDGFREFLKTKV